MESVDMSNVYEVKQHFPLRLNSEERASRMSKSLRRLQSENVSKWIREAIDLRLYFEERGYDFDYILSGDFLTDIESKNNRLNEVEKANVEKDFSPKQMEELVKAMLRTHAMNKRLLNIVMTNPNINIKGASYEATIKSISEATDKFYEHVFNIGD